MNDTATRYGETLTEFVAAVDYAAAVERPGLDLWEALAEALSQWLSDGRMTGSVGEDPLRSALRHLLQAIPEAGAPGGQYLAAILDAAASSWTEDMSRRLNDGLPFAS